MASPAVDQQMEQEQELKPQQKSFNERLSEIPTYTMTLSQLQSFYTSIKQRNQVLNNAFTTGEQYVGRFTEVAKPVVWAATNSAIKAAKPIVGEINDPVAKIDSCASEALAKVQEKFPIVTQTPSEIAESAKAKIKGTTDYYLNRVQDSSAVKTATHQLDNAVSFSELMVEICFPTDGSNPDDLAELEKAEEDEDKGLVVRAGNLKNRAVRRGKARLMEFTPVKTTVDTVQYAQQQISEMTDKLKQGTNYITTKTNEAKETITKSVPELRSAVSEKITEGSQLLTKQWDNVFQTTMYIPKKAIQVTGEVYVSAQEIVFAYGKAHSLSEMPHAVVEMAEKYYNNFDATQVEKLKEKALAFVFVPAQVVSEYLKSTRVVQWVIPNTVETESIQLLEVENEVESDEQS